MGRMIVSGQGQEQSPPGLEPTGVSCTGSPLADICHAAPCQGIQAAPRSKSQVLKANLQSTKARRSMVVPQSQSDPSIAAA